MHYFVIVSYSYWINIFQYRRFSNSWDKEGMPLLHSRVALRTFPIASLFWRATLYVRPPLLEFVLLLFLLKDCTKFASIPLYYLSSWEIFGSCCFFSQLTVRESTYDLWHLGSVPSHSLHNLSVVTNLLNQSCKMFKKIPTQSPSLSVNQHNRKLDFIKKLGLDFQLRNHQQCLGRDFRDEVKMLSADIQVFKIKLISLAMSSLSKLAGNYPTLAFPISKWVIKSSQKAPTITLSPCQTSFSHDLQLAQVSKNQQKKRVS